jgi:alkyl sulfatase BDS1-like metallo-beta-lactamase superfamily hydrolase
VEVFGWLSPLAFGGCSVPETMKAATGFTSAVNRDAVSRYAMDDRADFADIDRGLVAALDQQVFNDRGELIRDGTLVSYITDDAPPPDSVNPSLWRQSQLVKREGLYKVVDGLYQVRFGGANVTIADAPDGLVIIDTGTSVDLAKVGMQLFRHEMGNTKPVAAVIYTHTHFDHYAGVKGIIDEADVAAGKVPIVAPGTIASFDKYAIGENVITGNAMSRRMGYTFGLILPHCDTGLVTVGLGPADDGMHINISYISRPIRSPGPVRSAPWVAGTSSSSTPPTPKRPRRCTSGSPPSGH